MFPFNPDLENAMGESNFQQVYASETDNCNTIKSHYLRQYVMEKLLSF